MSWMRTFPGPNPLPLAQVMDMHAQGCKNHMSYVVLCTRAHEGGFRAHIEGGGGPGA